MISHIIMSLDYMTVIPSCPNIHTSTSPGLRVNQKRPLCHSRPLRLDHLNTCCSVTHFQANRYYLSGERREPQEEAGDESTSIFISSFTSRASDGENMTSWCWPMHDTAGLLLRRVCVSEPPACVALWFHLLTSTALSKWGRQRERKMNQQVFIYRNKGYNS